MNKEELKNKLKEIKKIEYKNDKMNALFNMQDEIEENGIDLYQTSFDDIVDYDTLETMAKHELDEYGIERLYYFLPSDKYGNPYHMEEYFIINGYGNAENITHDGINYIIDEILDLLGGVENE